MKHDGLSGWRHSCGITKCIFLHYAVFYNKLSDKWSNSRPGEGWALLEQLLLVVGNIYTNINTFKQSFTLLSIYRWCCNNTSTAVTCYVIEVSFIVSQLWYLILFGKLKVIAKTRLASAVEWFFLRIRENVHVRWILCFKCLETRWNDSCKHTSPINTMGVICVCISMNFCRNMYSNWNTITFSDFEPCL